MRDARTARELFAVISTALVARYLHTVKEGSQGGSAYRHRSQSWRLARRDASLSRNLGDRFVLTFILIRAFRAGSMNIGAKRLLERFVSEVVALMLAAAKEESSSDRPYIDGSDSFGDFNFRTRQMDCGTDPAGWYENEA
jgi:hypothetical protein